MTATVSDLDELIRRDGGLPELPITRKRGSHETNALFLRGPVPWAWITAASALPGSALATGLAIWMEAALKKSNEIMLPSKWVRQLGISRKAEARALAALERAALVGIDRRRGRRPRIRILEARQRATA